MHEINWDSEKISRIWQYYASNLAYKNIYFSKHSGKYILNSIRKYINFKNKKLLDFGCGPGYLIEKLLNFPCQINGLDFSKKSIEQANKKFKNHKNFAKAVSTDKLPSSFEDNSMDIVICVETLEHLKDKDLDQTLEEIYRILKKGGHVAITTPNKEDLELEKVMCPECGSVFHKWQHLRSWDSSSIKEKVESFGFKTLFVKSTIFGSFPKRMFYFLKKIIKKKPLPHLIYIEKK